MRGKKVKRIRKSIYGDCSYNLHKSKNPRLKAMGLRLRKQYQAAKKEAR